MSTPTLTANDPQAGAISWTAFNISYAGQTYAIAAGYTANKFVWWLYNDGAGGPLQAGDTLPTLTPDDVLLFLNKDGTPVNALNTQIVDGSIIASGSVLADAIAANTLTGEKMIAGAISAREMAVGSVETNALQALAITAEKIAANAIAAGKIAAGAVTAVTIAAGAVTTDKLDALAVTAEKVAAGAITAAKLSVTTLSAITANLGTVTAGIIRDAASKFVIDLAAKTLTVFDDQATPVKRVVVGSGATGYGIETYNAAGARTFTTAGLEAAATVNGMGADQVSDGAARARSGLTGTGGITGHDTTELIDGAQLGNQADYGQITNKPTTISELGMQDEIQPLLPEAVEDKQELLREVGGVPYWGRLFRAQGPFGAATFITSDTKISSTTAFNQLGNALRIPAQGVACTIWAIVHASIYNGTFAEIIVQISTDNGASWSGGGRGRTTSPDTTVSQYWSVSWNGTQDALVRLVAKGDMSIRASGYSTVSVVLIPSTDIQVAVDTAPLAVTIPGSAVGSCTKDIINGSTCTASTTVTANASGGAGSYGYSWSKVSGTDTITGGATSRTCTVSGTHTTADPAATTQTVINCTATSGSAQAASGNCTVTLSFQRTQSNVTASVANASCSCIGDPNKLCTASRPLTCAVTGGTGSYTYSWSKVSGSGAITSGASAETCTVSDTAITGTTSSGVFRCAVSSGGDSASDSGTMTFQHENFG
ncbi:MAG TPA: hypothetical protein VFN80_03270 [Acidothermaceae bacterium]|nr:hypothetical protein [Acidothermaceae bacterium]